MAEYNQRRRLQRMGLTSDVGTLDAETVEALLLVDVIYDEIEEAEAKKKRN